VPPTAIREISFLKELVCVRVCVCMYSVLFVIIGLNSFMWVYVVCVCVCVCVCVSESVCVCALIWNTSLTQVCMGCVWEYRYIVAV